MRHYDVVVNGRRFSLDVRELAADRFAVRLEEREIEVLIEDESEVAEATITPEIVSSSQHVEQRTAPARRSSAGEAPAVIERLPRAGGIATRPVITLKAPMPGSIVAVDVAPGAAVRRGDALLTLEAMKMRNAIRSPRDGVVAEVLVSPGQMVGYDDPLLRFDEEGR